jgi:hypothetical protein
MKKRTKVSISPSSYIMITTLIYAILNAIFLEFDIANGQSENFVDDKDNDKTTYSQQIIETECKSPCPPSAEMCIAMCA